MKGLDGLWGGISRLCNIDVKRLVVLFAGSLSRRVVMFYSEVERGGVNFGWPACERRSEEGRSRRQVGHNRQSTHDSGGRYLQ